MIILKNKAFLNDEKTFTVFVYCFLSILLLICLYPFLNVLAYSLSSNGAILSGTVTLYPMELQFESYKNILSRSTIGNALIVSVIVTLFGTLLGIFITICAAYALYKKRLKGRKFITGFILFTMYFNGGVIPTFLVVKNLGILDSNFSLILPSAMSCFYFIIMKSFFQQLPESLEEAATLDGCNDLSYLIKIALPLSLPIIATIGLFYAVGYWNDYFASLMYISSPEKFPMQLLLRQLIFTEALNQIGTAEGMAQAVMPESLKAASVVITIIPIIIVYPWLQKYFVKGVMLGSVKG